jgi:YbbR domain-containing protein
LEKIKKADIQVHVEHKGLQPGTHQMTPNVEVPKGIKVGRVEPPRLSVTVEDQNDREKDQ